VRPVRATVKAQGAYVLIVALTGRRCVGDYATQGVVSALTLRDSALGWRKIALSARTYCALLINLSYCANIVLNVWQKEKNGFGGKLRNRDLGGAKMCLLSQMATTKIQIAPDIVGNKPIFRANYASFASQTTLVCTPNKAPLQPKQGLFAVR
jgi:hypothetical protein